MDQNQPKSVWLRLILPICLGVFATAIYYNAIKTQKNHVEVWIAKQHLESKKEIDTSDPALFEVKTFVIHRDTENEIREALTPPQAGVILTTNRTIKEGDTVFRSDFVSPEGK